MFLKGNLNLEMSKTSFVVFFIFCEILKIALCENDPSYPFAFQISKKDDNFELGKEREKITLDSENNPVTLDTKNLEKRRLLFPGSDLNAEIHSNKFSINGEHLSRRKFDQDKTEGEHGFSEEMRDFESNLWENEKNKFSYVEKKGNRGSLMGFRSRQPVAGLNHTYDLDKSDVSEKNHFQWNKEKAFKHERPNSESTVGSHYIGRAFNDHLGDRSGGIFDRRVSVTLDEPEMKNLNKYNGGHRGDERRSGYHDTYSNMEYNNQKDNSFWDPNFYKREKGVIINFNTECPVTRQFNNHLLHRVIISPKSSLNSQSEISMYQYPGAGLISAHQLAPTYYF